jgi:hypothetical protein
MKTIRCWSLALLLGGISSALLAYGGGGGGGDSCPEPQFFRATPANDAVVTALTEFSISASENTDLASLDLRVNGDKVQPTITPQRSGDTRIEFRPASPIATAGRVRITLRARSREGCEAFLQIYVNIRP